MNNCCIKNNWLYDKKDKNKNKKEKKKTKRKGIIDFMTKETKPAKLSKMVVPFYIPTSSVWEL